MTSSRLSHIAAELISKKALQLRIPSRPYPCLLLLLGSLASRGSILLLLLSLFCSVIPLALLSIPLTGLQDQDTNQDQGKNGVASSQHAQRVLAAEQELAVVLCRMCEAVLVLLPQTGANGAQASDNVGDIDGNTNDVEDERGAVKEEVGLAGAEELDEETEEANADHNVEQAANQRRCGVHKLEMCLELVVELGSHGILAPEQRVVVGERGEEDAEEEAGG